MLANYLENYGIIYLNLVHIFYSTLPVLIMCIILILFFYLLKFPIKDGD